MASRRTQPKTAHPASPIHPQNLREKILTDFQALRIPLPAEAFDALLDRATREGLSHLEFLALVIGAQAGQRRERGIAYRIHKAGFKNPNTLADFDWNFNESINRTQIEDLCAGHFIGRRDNLIFAGQSGVGKSTIVQSIGRAACVLGYRVRYTTSAELIRILKASLADQTLHQKIRIWAAYDLLIIDEFGFDRLERQEARDAGSLLYKVIDARNQKHSTALVTNIDFDSWAEYLGDPPLAMALLDRIVDGAIIIKIKGKSYRAFRAQTQAKPANPSQ